MKKAEITAGPDVTNTAAVGSSLLEVAAVFDEEKCGLLCFYARTSVR